jgi:hypothetical protein
MPAAKAGRSIASRQSLGRLPPPWAPVSPAERMRRNRSAAALADRAAKPEITAQKAMTPVRWLAWAPRDRIFSRIRSRPSAPGST